MPLKIYPEAKKHPFSEIKNVVAVAAGKGGVGKSTITVNLALALKKQGYTVGILDADVYGPSIRKMLLEDNIPGNKNNGITPAICHGIEVISMAYFRKANESAAVRAPIANGVINQFIQNVAWSPLDFLLIDFPPGTGDIQLTLCQQANLSSAIMVTTPQEVATLDVRKAMHLFEQVQIPIIGIVENMSYYYHATTKEIIYLFGKGGGERLAKETHVPFLGSIPVDPLISLIGDQGASIFEKDEKSQSAARFLELATCVKEQLKKINDSNGTNLSNFELAWKEL